jgi:hypothetical protein
MSASHGALRNDSADKVGLQRPAEDTIDFVVWYLHGLLKYLWGWNDGNLLG